MALLKTLRSVKDNYAQKGMTFVEVLIAVAILAVILSVGLFIGFDFYKSYSFRAERNAIVSVLQKARSQSLNNINQTRHGVHFEPDDSDPTKIDSYIIFECPPGTPCNSYNPGYPQIIIDSSWGIYIDDLPIDVIFNQLDGSLISSDCSTNPLSILNITVSHEAKSYDISVNCEGQINW